MWMNACILSTIWSTSYWTLLIYAWSQIALIYHSAKLVTMFQFYIMYSCFWVPLELSHQSKKVNQALKDYRFYYTWVSCKVLAFTKSWNCIFWVLWFQCNRNKHCRILAFWAGCKCRNKSEKMTIYRDHKEKYLNAPYCKYYPCHQCLNVHMCCVFRQANRCSTRHLLVKIICFCT